MFVVRRCLPRSVWVASQLVRSSGPKGANRRSWSVKLDLDLRHGSSRWIGSGSSSSSGDGDKGVPEKETPAKDEQKKAKKLSDDPEIRKILDSVLKDFESDDKAMRGDHKFSTADDAQPDTIPPSFADRFVPFSDKDASVILDVSELEQLQRSKYEDGDDDHQEFYSIYHERRRSPLETLELQRGVTGVFDIEELVDVLQKENALDVCVIEVPKHFHYVDYMVLATAKSPRHVLALSEFLRKMYKKKKCNADPFIYPEGKATNDWHVMDMSNIVLHIFQASTREKYDLETLWTVGPAYDDQLQRPSVDPAEQRLLDIFQWENVEPPQPATTP